MKNWFICLLFDLLHQIDALCVVVEINIRGDVLLPPAGARSKKKTILVQAFINIRGHGSLPGGPWGAPAGGNDT